MRVPGLGVRVTAFTTAVGVLVACGGGGSGYGSMGSSSGGGTYGVTPMPMPTVTFSAPTQASTISLGQGVMLAWTSTYASSCTATASSMIGGSFTGTQPASGQVTVVPTGSGTVSYTLMCTGTGGSASATTQTVTVNPSILSTLASAKAVTIGSTLDPIEKGGNPYGLALAPVSAGLMTAGDLVVCNFNDGATNTQGLGTTIVGLHPAPGATPYRIAQSSKLQGCNALAMLPDGSISAAAFSANQNPLVSPAGAVTTPFAADSFAGPWGQAYVPANGNTPAAIYVADVGGSIERIALTSCFCKTGEPHLYRR